MISSQRDRNSPNVSLTKTQKDFTNMNNKYYLCEAESADDGVTKVTGYDQAEEVLQAAEESTAAVHFISTINPLAENEEGEDEK